MTYSSLNRLIKVYDHRLFINMDENTSKQGKGSISIVYSAHDSELIKFTSNDVEALPTLFGFKYGVCLFRAVSALLLTPLNER